MSFSQDEDKNHASVQAYGGKEGIFVEQVEPGGPAEKAGVQAGDIIIALNGKPVARGQELIDSVADAAVGDKDSDHESCATERREDFNVVIGGPQQGFRQAVWRSAQRAVRAGGGNSSQVRHVSPEPKRLFTPDPGIQGAGGGSGHASRVGFLR